MTKKLALLMFVAGFVAPMLGCSEKRNEVILATPERIERWENYGEVSSDEYKDRSRGSRAIPKP
ncbi:hypothetical protein SAMN06265222_11042 [Neorhodopirellula lusitana]|uniref:Secreted protein n=1 Tax=Neorhodopirellula lusitana TaxID=445327 RepID=A0ABY1QFB8_9BACT|nr:hypothetical protein [Neorhodopirellula lusitana]SMP66794.1 hypothetical protein SAMN06265222_11042 [Neorhodopirellula lusitana]